MRSRSDRLPPLEALACGTPVVVSQVASLPEVCADAALYCDPDDPRDIANELGRLLDDVDLREVLVSNGKRVVERTTWAVAASRLRGIIEALLAREGN